MGRIYLGNSSLDISQLSLIIKKRMLNTASRKSETSNLLGKVALSAFIDLINSKETRCYVVIMDKVP